MTQEAIAYPGLQVFILIMSEGRALIWEETHHYPVIGRSVPYPLLLCKDLSWTDKVLIEQEWV